MRDFTVGNLIKSYRTRLGLKQEEVANPDTPELLPVALRTYQGWENGERIPSNKWLYRVASFFRLTDAEADELYRAAAQVAPEIHNLPFQRNPLFTGRERYLELLEQHFKENRSVAITQPLSISGLGGIGKTELALEYAHRYSKLYRTVLWVNATDRATLETSYLSLADLLQLPEKNERETDRIVQAVKTWLEGHTGWLLILDNADDLPLVRSFFPAKPRGHILLTTRSQIVGSKMVRIEIEVMEPEEGLIFLLRRTGMLKDGSAPDIIASDIYNAARQLVDLLGNHPLALDQAGAYIEETEVSFAEYLRIYADQRLILLSRRGWSGDEHPETVTVTFEISFQRACKLCPPAADILYFCSFLYPDDIPEELFSQDDGLKLSIPAFYEAIAALRRYSLIKRNDEKKLLSVHRLVQAVLADKMDTQTQRLWAERVIIALYAIVPDGEDHQWSHYERILNHLLKCVDLIDRWQIYTPAAAYLLHDTARYLHGRVRFAEAKPLYLRTVEIRQQALGRVHPDLIDPLLDLANLCQDEGQYTEAQAYYQEVLDICEQTLAPDEPVITSAMRGLARNYFRQDDPTMALMVYHIVLQAEEPPRVTTLSEAGHVYQRMGHYTGAELLYQQALEVCKETREPNDPDLSIPLADLAGLYQEQGNYDQAEALYRQVLHIDEQVLGSDHPNLSFVLDSLADLYRT